MNAPAKSITFIFDFVAYDRNVFRAFSTAYPSQELFDDLLENAHEREALKPNYYCENFPETMDRLERVLGRSTDQIIQEEISSKFLPGNWYKSRYSDGTFPVLYAAENQETAVEESLYHKRIFMKEEVARGPVSLDLKVISLHLITPKAVDLTIQKDLDPNQLMSQEKPGEESGYPYCQDIANQCRDKGAQLLRAASARRDKGICTPIFDRTAIKKDRGHLLCVKCVLGKDGNEVYWPRGY
jgi:hypothetical protein